MSKELESLQIRIENLEQLNTNRHAEIEELEFKDFKVELSIEGNLRVGASGNQRKWRETRDFRGAEKYSNWSATVYITDLNNNPAVCDWIKLSDCNYRIKQALVVVDRANFGFTTDTGHGWDNIKFDVEVKRNGVVFNKVHVEM